MKENKIIKKLKPIFIFIKYIILALLVYLGLKQVKKIVKSIQGEVKTPQGFFPGDAPNTIRILNEEDKMVEVKLPKGITNDQVIRAGKGKGDKIHVEIKHDTIDINNIPDTNNKTLDIR